MMLAASRPLSAETLVVVSSTATREYVDSRQVDGKRRRQTYVFMAGRYLAGSTRDRSLENASFRTIAENLAMDLRRQDYLPAPSLREANLLLVVHWGVTFGRNRDAVALSLGAENLANIGRESENARENLKEAVASGDVDAASQARGQLDNLANDARFEQEALVHDQLAPGEDSGALLGLSADLRKDDESLFAYERRKAMFEMTREERYFLIVMAYDVPTLLSTGKLKRVWTLRGSISTAGINFPQALDRICNISGQYFGTRPDSVTFNYTGDRARKESVTLGELVVIGSAGR